MQTGGSIDIREPRKGRPFLLSPSTLALQTCNKADTRKDKPRACIGSLDPLWTLYPDFRILYPPSLCRLDAPVLSPWPPAVCGLVREACVWL